MEDQIGMDGLGGSQGPGMVTRAVEQVGDQAVQAKEAVVGFGRRTAGGIDAQRHPAAAALDQTALALHQQTDKVAGLAHSTAAQVQATADYVRTHDVKAMGRDIQGLVTRYPAQALIGAALIGFVVARAVRGRT